MIDDRFNASILHLIRLYAEANDLKTFDLLLSAKNYIALINNVQPVEYIKICRINHKMQCTGEKLCISYLVAYCSILECVSS